MRPVDRPPMAVLTAVDDDEVAVGEQWRVRKAEFTIGRDQGDAQIENDAQISALHAAIGYYRERSHYRWYFRDLESRNGSHMRVRHALLRHGTELVIGHRRYEFQSFPALAGGTSPPGQTRAASPKAWPENVGPCLVDHDSGESHPLKKAGSVVGRSASESDVVLNDPFVDQRHVRIWQASNGQWRVVDLGSRNGVWLRVTRCVLQREHEFLLGEQRFHLRIHGVI